MQKTVHDDDDDDDDNNNNNNNNNNVSVYFVVPNIQQNKLSYTETCWKTNGQGNKIKNSQHYS